MLLVVFFAVGVSQMGGPHYNITPNTINSSAVTPAGSQTDYSGKACTSIVAQDNTGNVIHGRNMDWKMPDDLRNMTVLVYIQIQPTFII